MRRIAKRHLPAGVIQICWIAPGPSIAAIVKVSPGFIRTYGFTFQPCPRARAALAALATFGLSLSSRRAMPALPFSPVKFSGLIDRVFASESRYKFPIFISRPLKRAWENTRNGINKNINESTRFFFILSGLKVMCHRKILILYYIDLLKIKQISAFSG